ncbi:hypothetical protein D3C87_2001070 [compost metagenome]
MRAELKRHTLADLAERANEKAPAAFGAQVVNWLTDRQANRRGDKSAPRRGRVRKTA